MPFGFSCAANAAVATKAYKATPSVPIGQGSYTFTLRTTATAGTKPYMIGLVGKKGEFINTMRLNTGNWFCHVLRRWNDGSIKHALMVGRAALTSTATTITVTDGLVPAPGVFLTEQDIANANPVASVTVSGMGTVSLSSLLGTPYRVPYSSPEMVEAHYRALMPLSSTQMMVIFQVRRFADGTMWARAICENGFMTNAAGTALGENIDRTYTATVNLFGTQVYNASVRHQAFAAWSVESWNGDPGVIPGHNTTYIQSANITPTYGWTGPSATALNALFQTYTPMTIGQNSRIMYSTGDAPGIGILPNWDALFITSGGDSRAWKAVQAQSSTMNSYGITRRDRFTNDMPKMTDYSGWAIRNGPSGGGANEFPITDGSATDANTNYWDHGHLPSAGYMAYVITGDMWHYETMQKCAYMCWLMQPPTMGTGVNRFLQTQTRMAAWSMRTIGQLCAIAPDTEIADSTSFGGLMRQLLANNYTSHKALLQDGSNRANLGGLWYQSYGAWDIDSNPNNPPGSIAPWMLHYLNQSTSHLSEIDPLADMTNLITTRDLLYKFPVGLLGQSGVSTDYSFTHAARYGLAAAVDNGGVWRSSFGAIFTAQTGSSNTTATNTLTGGGSSQPSLSPKGYWGYLMPAIAYAVDHGATGAQASWDRLTGASNWSTVNTSGFEDLPVFGIKPRNGSSSQPTWMNSISGVKTWFQIPNTAMSNAQNQYTMPKQQNGSAAIATDWLVWSGGAVAGKKLVFHGGGHTNYSGNEVVGLDLGLNTPGWTGKGNGWQPLRIPTSNANVQENVFHYAFDGSPTSRHSYFEECYDAVRNKLMFVGCSSGFGNNPANGFMVDGFDLTTLRYDNESGNGPNGAGASISYPQDATGLPVSIHPQGLPQCTGPDGNVYIAHPSNGILKYNMSTRAYSGYAGGSWTRNSGYGCIAVDSARDECIVLGGTGHVKYTGFINGSKTPSSLTLTGSKAGSIDFSAATMYYVADLGKYIIFPWSASDNNIYEINPAANYSCEIFAVTGTPPPKAAAGSGIEALFTRFFLMPELKLMGVYGSSGVTSNTYVFKYL